MQRMIQRLDAAERSRRKTLEGKRKEKDYAAKLDKKSCPICGVVQTYEELEEKRNRCQVPECNGIKYTIKVGRHTKVSI